MSRASMLIEHLDTWFSMFGEHDTGGDGGECPGGCGGECARCNGRGGRGSDDATTVYVFKGFHASGFGGGATASTKNTEDQLRAKGLTSGVDYEWLSPYKLEIRQCCIDRDILDVIQSEGGTESEEELEHS